MPNEPKAITAEQMRQLLSARVQGIMRQRQAAHSILHDITNKVTQAGSLIGHAPTAADDAFEQTADMLLEQAQKQLRSLHEGIQIVRDQIVKLRVLQPEAPAATTAEPVKPDAAPTT